ncbi:GNAT family N-acetyltransferase [Sedimenticola hydrogenitrophicus]|uniref:GNAT family N-acetyltransferase n=1 Tax=Sedimenticola hydrogenitrophicus TaxID=2967975 RepID=UPI0023AF63E5|nr:GNAT family N-acetyltransferase [Sedimenticola hydrogenitrophicus]
MLERNCQIQPLQDGDIEQVIGLDKNLGGSARPEFFHKRLQAMGRSPSTYISFVASVNGQLCGFLFANVLSGEFGTQQPVAVIDALGVQPGDQGSGVGMLLMNALKDEAAKRGCGSLRTEANWHQQELLAYFANAGFSLAARNVLTRDTRPLTLAEEDATELRPVRSLAASDLDSIRRIDRHITGEDRADYLQQKVAEVISDSGIRVSMVAEQDGLVAGFVMARVDYGSFGCAESTAVVDTLGVGPEYKGSGIGSALMAQLMDNLASLQVEHVRTEVEWENFDLNRFLAGSGFRPAQELSLSCAL